MIQRGRSKSVLKYSANRKEAPSREQLLEDRIASYTRSKTDVDRIEKALKKIKGKKGYEVIEMRYLKRKI